MFDDLTKIELQARLNAVAKRGSIPLLCIVLMSYRILSLRESTVVIIILVISALIASFISYEAYFRIRGSTIVTAERNGRVVGFADFNKCFLRGCFVHPRWQGMGVGKELLYSILGKGMCDTIKYASSHLLDADDALRGFGFEVHQMGNSIRSFRIPKNLNFRSD